MLLLTKIGRKKTKKPSEGVTPRFIIQQRGPIFCIFKQVSAICADDVPRPEEVLQRRRKVSLN